MYPPNADLPSYHEMLLGKCSCPREPVMGQIPLFKIIHHPLGKLPETEGGFQERTMWSFGGQRGIGKELVEKALWNAQTQVFPSMCVHARTCVCVCVHMCACECVCL